MSETVWRTKTRSGYVVSTIRGDFSFGNKFETVVLDRMGRELDDTFTRSEERSDAELVHRFLVKAYTETVGFDANGSPCEAWE